MPLGFWFDLLEARFDFDVGADALSAQLQEPTLTAPPPRAYCLGIGIGYFNVVLYVFLFTTAAPIEVVVAVQRYGRGGPGGGLAVLERLSITVHSMYSNMYWCTCSP